MPIKPIIIDYYGFFRGVIHEINIFFEVISFPV